MDTLRNRVTEIPRIQGTLNLDENKHARSWREFKAANPNVFALFRSKALEMLVRKRRFGIAMLVESARWDIRRDWELDESGFKLNNNHRAYIARDLIASMPDLVDLIETRRTRTPQ